MIAGALIGQDVPWTVSERESLHWFGGEGGTRPRGLHDPLKGSCARA